MPGTGIVDEAAPGIDVSRRPNWSLLWLLALLASAQVVGAATRYGLGASADSIWYFRAASSLLNDASLPDGYLNWPPLYPSVLALVSGISGLAINNAALILHLLLYGLVVVDAARWAYSRTSSPAAAYGVALALAVAPPLLFVMESAWSEPLFLWLIIRSLCTMDQPESRGNWMVAGVYAGLAAMTRYAGFSILLAGLVISLTKSKEPARAGLQFSIPAFVPLGAWCIRNWLLAGTPFGSRESGTGDFGAIFAGLWGTLQEWSWLLCACLAACGLLLARTLLLPRAEPGRAGTFSWPAPIYAGIYLVFIVWSASTITYDPIGTRLLIPIYVPVTVVAIASLARSVDLLFPRPARAPQLLTLGLLLTLAPSALTLVSLIQYSRQTGIGSFNNARWENSAILQALQGQPLVKPIFSNAPELLWLNFGIDASMSPGRARGDTPAAWIIPGSATLVWFAAMRRDYLIPPAELEQSVELIPLITASDGAWYQVRPMHPAE